MSDVQVKIGLLVGSNGKFNAMSYNEDGSEPDWGIMMDGLMEKRNGDWVDPEAMQKYVVHVLVEIPGIIETFAAAEKIEEAGS